VVLKSVCTVLGPLFGSAKGFWVVYDQSGLASLAHVVLILIPNEVRSCTLV